MTTVSMINPNRIVPVQEDLTTPVNQLEIIRGWEKMHRVDKQFTDTFVAGEWAVLGDNDKLTRPGATAAKNTYLVFCGNDRTDVAATGKVGIVMASKIVVRTTMFVADTYHVGDALNVKNPLSNDNASIGKAAGGEPVLAYLTKLGTNFIEFETV